uniref:Uncharacterized protein n=1 Tax=Ditylenchus dipsaci TaxID=166011 RepID=A0A915DP92_9BILA
MYWWLCEQTEDTTKQGLVPRNYLSLFPIWRHRHRHNFQNFELPSAALLPSTGATASKWTESETDVITVNPPSSTTNASRELSTYA